MAFHRRVKLEHWHVGGVRRAAPPELHRAFPEAAVVLYSPADVKARDSRRGDKVKCRPAAAAK